MRYLEFLYFFRALFFRYLVSFYEVERQKNVYSLASR